MGFGPMDDRKRVWVSWTLAYIAFVLALTWFGAWVWPVLGPWVWKHI
jgi:hypothetical protein